MATPQRSFPDEPRREPELVRNRRVSAGRLNGREIDTRPIDDRRGGGASFSWLWIVLLIAAIFWFCGRGWDGYGGWWRGRGAATTMQPAGAAAGRGSAAGKNGSQGRPAEPAEAPQP